MATRKLTQAQINRIVARKERERSASQRYIFRRSKTEIQRVYIDSAKAYPSTPEIERVQKSHVANMRRILRNGYNILKPGPKTQLKQNRKGIIDDAVNSFWDDWVNNRSLRNALEISRTTAKDIGQIIRDALADGLGSEAISDMILASAPDVSTTRANTIARTESHSAQMESETMTVEALDDLTGEQSLKSWLPVEDERTRSSHAAMFGQAPIPINEKFNVGGVMLRYPGDQEANAPSETINCRCVLLYE